MLMLPGGVFDDEGVRRLAGMTTLEEVSLDSDKVTDASIDALGSLKSLRKLHLGRARLTPAGRQRLASLLPAAVITP
jgi:hypothetical protein